VPRGITGPLCHWGYKYKDMILQVGFWIKGDDLASKINIVVKSKVVKPGCSAAESSKEEYRFKKSCV
jgi:hypothetical protein